MDDFEDMPEDLEDVEVIYLDDEAENVEEMPDEDEEIVDSSKLTFTRHSKSVFTGALSPDNGTAVTGGEDDMAFVWNPADGEVIFECTGHKDSVTEVGFSFDGQYIATADMGGMIQVWSPKDKKLVWCFEGDDMEWLSWHPMGNVLLCGCQSGDIYVWQIPQGNCKVLPSPGNSSTTCGKVMPDGKHLLTGYDNGELKLWNLKDTTVVWTNSQCRTVTNLDVNPEGTLAIVAPEAHIIKASDGKTITTVKLDGETEIESALFSPKNDTVVTGSLSGQLCVWELGRYSLRHQACIECAVTVLKWGLDGRIFVGATDGAIYVCDVKSGTLLETLTGHKSEILSITVFNDGTRILSTSDDGTAKIFEIKT